MHLTYRPATEEDVETCARLILEQFIYPPEVRHRIPGLWQSWLRSSLLAMTVIEDELRPPESRCVAFGNSVFVTDTFMREVRAGLPPYVSAQITQRFLAGRPAILDPTAVRKASDGLNLIVLHIGWPENDLDAEECRRVKAKLVEAFFYTHAGYPIKDFAQEVFTVEEVQRAAAAGLVIYNDYSGYFAEHPEDAPDDSFWPCLMGTDRETVEEGSYVAPMFAYTPPRFLFTPSEQDLLKLALIDKTDDEIARYLHISESAVQKRWQSIFDRASQQNEIRWLPYSDEAEREARTRGVEKRRHLLSYLRSHPEELRPVGANNHRDGK